MTTDKDRPRDADGIEPRDRTDGPGHTPSGTLDGHPINADETAPEASAPRPRDRDGGERHPEAVEDEPGSDL